MNLLSFPSNFPLILICKLIPLPTICALIVIGCSSSHTTTTLPRAERMSVALLYDQTAAGTVTADDPDPFSFVPDAEYPNVDLDDLRKHIKYPEDARRKNTEGRVVVHVLIDVTGRPVKAFIGRSENLMLNRAALDAVMSAKYSPGRRGGNAIRLWTVVPVEFSLVSRSRVLLSW